MNNKLVPDNYEVPETLETSRFKLRMLTIHDVDKDYDAVMTSIDYLQGVFGPNHKWPTKELTHEQDLIDLGWHQKEFQRKSSFAYTVMKPDESECLGCIYIYPSDNKNFDVMIMMWVRASKKDTGLDEELFKTVKEWINKSWPFEKPGYPGRDITWDEWNR